MELICVICYARLWFNLTLVKDLEEAEEVYTLLSAGHLEIDRSCWEVLTGNLLVGGHWQMESAWSGEASPPCRAICQYSICCKYWSGIVEFFNAVVWKCPATSCASYFNVCHCVSLSGFVQGFRLIIHPSWSILCAVDRQHLLTSTFNYLIRMFNVEDDVQVQYNVKIRREISECPAQVKLESNGNWRGNLGRI